MNKTDKITPKLNDTFDTRDESLTTSTASTFGDDFWLDPRGARLPGDEFFLRLDLEGILYFAMAQLSPDDAYRL